MEILILMFLKGLDSWIYIPERIFIALGCGLNIGNYVISFLLVSGQMDQRGGMYGTEIKFQVDRKSVRTGAWVAGNVGIFVHSSILAVRLSTSRDPLH